MKNSICYFTTNNVLRALAAQISHNVFHKLKKDIKSLKRKKEEVRLTRGNYEDTCRYDIGCFYLNF